MNPENDKPIIFFDGVCNLCNGLVQFIIRHDKKGKFRFASLQSETAVRLLEGKVDMKEMRTLILLDNGKVYLRSRAVLRVASRLDGIWKASGILYIFPVFLADPVYNLVSRYRYRLFGKKDTCMVPTPEIKSRFV